MKEIKLLVDEDTLDRLVMQHLDNDAKFIQENEVEHVDELLRAIDTLRRYWYV